MEEGAERSIDELGMALMIGQKLRHASRSILRVISHPNRAVRKFFSLIRQRVRLQIVHHLQLVFDVPKKQIGGQQGVALLR